MASALSNLKAALGNTQTGKPIAVLMNNSAKQSQKQKYTDAKKLAKMLMGMGKEVSISVSGNGFNVTSVKAGEMQTPEAENPWNEVLK